MCFLTSHECQQVHKQKAEQTQSSVCLCVCVCVCVHVHVCLLCQHPLAKLAPICSGTCHVQWHLLYQFDLLCAPIYCI